MEVCDDPSMELESLRTAHGLMPVQEDLTF